jgi:hypothetical protein
MHTVRGYKVWTADGKMHKVQFWTDAPDDEIQIVVTYMVEEWAPGRPYRAMIDGCDWYFESGEEYPGQIGGVRSKSFDGEDEPFPEGVSRVKHGTAIETERFRIMAAEAWAEVSYD